MIGPTDILYVHDFTGDPDYTLPHVIVLEVLAGTMMINDMLFDDLIKQGKSSKSHEMVVKSSEDVFEIRIRQTFHFELKSDLMHFRLRIQ